MRALADKRSTVAVKSQIPNWLSDVLTAEVIDVEPTVVVVFVVVVVVIGPALAGIDAAMASMCAFNALAPVFSFAY